MENKNFALEKTATVLTGDDFFSQGIIKEINWEEKTVTVKLFRGPSVVYKMEHLAVEEDSFEHQLINAIKNKIEATIGQYEIAFLKILYSTKPDFTQLFKELKEQQQTNSKLMENLIGNKANELLKLLP